MGMVTTRVAAFRLHPNLSWNAATMTSRMETSDVSPANTREPKNSTPSTAPKGASETMVGKVMNASPMPAPATSSTAVPALWAMKPRAAKTPMPARISNPELAKATTMPEPVKSVLRLR